MRDSERVGELRQIARHDRRLLRRQARDEHVLPGPRELLRDPDDLLGGLRLGEDHLGHSLAQRAVVIDDGVAEVDEGEILQLGEGGVDRRFAGAHPLEERS